MNERRSVHRTQWAAQFAVASELCKRNYQVALTMGNHPMVDIMVISPGGIQFSVDVKGQYRRNFWPVREQRLRASMFYIFSFMPQDEPKRFFIMTQQQVNDAILANLKKYCERRNIEMTSRENPFPGVEWIHAQPHENQWAQLPE
jgi:hypothetical protein